MVIILDLNSTVNVTCWQSTLPFRGSLTVLVPKIVALTPIVPLSVSDLTLEGYCTWMICSNQRRPESQGQR
jgi:hypothetical protein